MKTRIVICFFIILLIQCSDLKDNEQVADISACAGSIVKMKEKLLAIKQMCPVHIALLDTIFLFRTQSNCDENYFHVYQYPNFRHINSFGKHGKGPNEFLEGELTYPSNSSMVDSIIWLQDMNNKKFKKLNLINGHVTETILFPKGVGMPASVTIVENKLIIGNCVSKYLGSFFKYDIQSKKLDVNYDVPTNKSHVRGEKKLLVYKNVIRVNQKRARIVIAYEFFGQIDIFDLDLKKVLSIKIDSKKTNARWNKGELYEVPENASHFFSDLQLTDENIYVLLNNYKMSFEEVSSFNSSTVLKFNWEGKLLDKYVLDDNVDRFIMDENLSRIITIKYSAEDPFWLFKM